MPITATTDMTASISLNHGSGGLLSRQLVDELFVPAFSNEWLGELGDSAVLPLGSGDLAFTTDAFVVDPVEFPGGNIGKLAVCGTVNDLAVSGAHPLYLSASFILEEGLDYGLLARMVRSMAEEAAEAGVRIVTGDTKVVRRGQCDKLFITTSGVGVYETTFRPQGGLQRLRPGDVLLINGGIAEHGMAVLCAREQLKFRTTIRSDCASLNGLIREVLRMETALRFMRDATRGGLATVLCELAAKTGLGITLSEPDIPVGSEVRGLCDLLGFDPLYVANEGKVVMAVAQEKAAEVLGLLRAHPLGREAAIIGRIGEQRDGIVTLQTDVGGRRIVDMLAGDQLPRIC
jgi:hydrogenase expression/formation protein HypE